MDLKGAREYFVQQEAERARLAAEQAAEFVEGFNDDVVDDYDQYADLYDDDDDSSKKKKSKKGKKGKGGRNKTASPTLSLRNAGAAVERAEGVRGAAMRRPEIRAFAERRARAAGGAGARPHRRRPSRASPSPSPSVASEAATITLVATITDAAGCREGEYILHYKSILGRRVSCDVATKVRTRPKTQRKRSHAVAVVIRPHRVRVPAPRLPRVPHQRSPRAASTARARPQAGDVAGRVQKSPCPWRS